MSYADKVFKDMCKNILENGVSDENVETRPIWTDTNTKAKTIKTFGVVNRYDLRKEFPAITLRKTYIKSAFDELLWIWQKKSNNVNDLNSKIWNEWADENGFIGTAYGYQMKKKHIHGSFKLDSKEETTEKFEEVNRMIRKENYPSMFPTCSLETNTVTFQVDQTDGVLYDLKHNPYSRGIVTTLWDPSDLHSMNLRPCAWSVTFNVTPPRKRGSKPVLNMILNQRSSDVLVANNWNVCQYALLLMMMAQVSNMEAGELVHCIADCHIYDRHIDMVKELIGREEYPAPRVYLNPGKKDFYKFTVDDLEIKDYRHGEKLDIPVAV